MGKKHFLLLFLILLLVFLVRLPSLFEPYWYGDEGIYFAVAETLKRGGVLYRDVIDNKPPLIYYLFAFLRTQFWVRVFASGWVLANTIVVYCLGKRLLGKRAALVAAFFFGLLASLPLLEGNIANGELFFILPVTLGFWLTLSEPGIRVGRLVLAGFFFALAFLFKAPALTDFGAVAFFIFLTQNSFKEFFRKTAWLNLGFLATVAPFLLYFLLKDCFSEFMAASFFNNLTYTTAWAGGRLGPQGLLWLKFGLVAGWCFLLFVFRKKTSPALLLVYVWTAFSLLGATLSNRPYPHYLIQAVPVFALLLGKLVSQKRHFFDLFLIFLMVVVANRLFGVGGAKFKYQKAYFSNFKNFVSGEKSGREYLTFFDPITLRNYQVAGFLKEKTVPEDRIFIWGDQSLIYALSRRAAIGRYVAAHHVNDVPGAREETIKALEKERPSFVLVDKGTTFPFPGLFRLLKRGYNKRVQFGLIVVYERAEV